MGYGLPVFLVYVLLLGVGKYFLFRQKASKFFTETGLNWDYVISQESKRKQVLLRFFALFTQVKGDFKQCQASCLSGLYPKGCSEGAWKDLAKSLSAFLSAKWRPLCAQSPSAPTFLAGAGLYRASLDCDSVVVLFDYLLLFQLLALYHAFDYQYLTPTLSTGQGAKGKRLAVSS